MRKTGMGREVRNESIACRPCSLNFVDKLLKTHFGLHNTLMTLSSLEIRNFGALCISYRQGASNGVIKLAINKI